MPLFDIPVEHPLPRQYQQLLNQGRRSPVSSSVPPVLFGKSKAPYVQKLELVLIDATHPALYWEEPDVPNISHYNVYVRFADTGAWVFQTAVEHSPAQFAAPTSGEVRCIVQTVMRNGYTSSLEDSPSATGILSASISLSGPTQETPVGTIDGVNPTFTISRSPAFLMLFRNGVKLEDGIGFIRTGTTITFQAGYIPFAGDVLRAILFG